MPGLDQAEDIWPRNDAAKPEELLDFAAKLAAEAAEEIKDPRDLRGLADAVEGCAPPGAVLESFDTIPYRELKWMWNKRFPRGKLTLLIGNPGLGKSILLADMCAHVSTGSDWPDGAPCEVGSAIILSAEDDPCDTIKPRLVAAGANLSKVHLLKAVRREMRDGRTKLDRFCFEQDTQALRDAILGIADMRLVCVDPVSAYLGRSNSHINSEIRALLSPLAELAAETGVSVSAVTHLTKAGSNAALLRAIGSIAFVAAARSVWFVGADPEDSERRVFLPVKSNLTRATTGLRFSLQEAGSAVRIVWGEKTDLTAEAVLASEQPSQVESASAWLKAQLSDGPVDSAELQRRSEAAQFSWASIRRAKETIRAVCRKSRGKQGGWTWGLPPNTLPAVNTLRTLSALSTLPKDAQPAQDVQEAQRQEGELASEHRRQPHLSRNVRKRKGPHPDAAPRNGQVSTLPAPSGKSARKSLILKRGASA